MVAEGRRKGMVTEEDAQQIRSCIKEPFVQKYLKSLAVHVCTLPVTQVVSVAVAVWYKVANGLSWADAWKEMVFILWVFQVTPISPGSLVRGLYVVYLVLRERNFRDYNIAVFLGFFKYVGYLAFPIQMAYRYPALARFMAAHWATGAANVVPVFGEHGALLEHAVFDLFYNRPLTVRRQMRRRAELRAALPARRWHVGAVALAGAGVFAAAELLWLRKYSALPSMRDLWLLVIAVGLLMGRLVTLGAGGAALFDRIKWATMCGMLAGTAAGLSNAVFSVMPGSPLGIHWGEAVTGRVLAAVMWRMFLWGLLAGIGAVLTEVFLGEPPTSLAATSSTGAAR